MLSGLGAERKVQGARRRPKITVWHKRDAMTQRAGIHRAIATGCLALLLLFFFFLPEWNEMKAHKKGRRPFPAQKTGL